MLLRGSVAAAQQRQRLGGLLPLRQPLRQVGVVEQKIVQRLLQPVLAVIAGDGGKTAGDPGKAQLRVRFPDPVGGALRYVAKALLAGGQRLLALLQQKSADVAMTRFAQRVAHQHGGGEKGGAHQQRQQRQQPGEQRAAGIVALPLQRHDAAQRRREVAVMLACALGRRVGVAKFFNAILRARACQLGGGQTIDKNHDRRRARDHFYAVVAAGGNPGGAEQRQLVADAHQPRYRLAVALL